jgi:hypothetical protein
VWRIFSRVINILLAFSCEDKSFQTDLLRRIKGEDKKFFILITMNIAISITIITTIIITISVIKYNQLLLTMLVLALLYEVLFKLLLLFFLL